MANSLTPEQRAAKCLELHGSKSFNDSVLIPIDLEERIAHAIRSAQEAGAARSRQQAKDLYDALKLMVSPFDHLPGCLWRSDKRMPCQCDPRGRANQALEQARAVIGKYEAEESEQMV